MKKHEFEAVAVTAGGKKIGELIVSVELADELRLDPRLPEEPELTIGHFKANLSKTAKMVVLSK